jgi:hypothetical protein
MFLTLFFCALTGFPCKAVTPPLPPFASFEACIIRGDQLAQEWLAKHPDWQEGGVRCASGRPK